MTQVDLNKYREFVLEVTSKPSKDLTEFMNRLDDLEASEHPPQPTKSPTTKLLDINVQGCVLHILHPNTPV